MMGTASCGPCHQAVAQSYQQTPHFLTSSRATSNTILGSFLEGRNILQTANSGVSFRMGRKGDAFYQTALDHGKTHSERFDLVLGSDGAAKLPRLESGLLYQLPVSYLARGAATGGWINSPGYPDGEVHFDRGIPMRCLECHATEGARAGQFMAGITCDKCHGPADQHPAIRNPATLDRDGKVALCAACHSGLGNNAEADVHGNQVGLLKQSQCFRPAPRCPVPPATTSTRGAGSRGHVGPLLYLPCLPEASQVVATDNCIDCHMPKQDSKVITFQTSDAQIAQQYRTHRISGRAGASACQPHPSCLLLPAISQAPAPDPTRVEFTNIASEAESRSATRTALRPRSTCSRPSAPASA